MEMLDVVDESDNVIAQAPRSQIHQQKLLHRATHIILTDSSQRIFMQLRSKTKDSNPGLWDTSAAGHVDAGETYLNCAARELEEELGVVVRPEALKEVVRVYPEEQNGYEFVWVYEATSDAPITLEEGEIDDGQWLSAQELDQRIAQTPDAYTKTFCVIWLAYKSWLKTGAGKLA